MFISYLGILALNGEKRSFYSCTYVTVDSDHWGDSNTCGILLKNTLHLITHIPNSILRHKLLLFQLYQSFIKSLPTPKKITHCKTIKWVLDLCSVDFSGVLADTSWALPVLTGLLYLLQIEIFKVIRTQVRLTLAAWLTTVDFGRIFFTLKLQYLGTHSDRNISVCIVR